VFWSLVAVAVVVMRGLAVLAVVSLLVKVSATIVVPSVLVMAAHKHMEMR
jgi:hypothetical protein